MKRINIWFVVIGILVCVLNMQGQTIYRSFSFLHLPNHSLELALGGSAVSFTQSKSNMQFSNPALSDTVNRWQIQNAGIFQSRFTGFSYQNPKGYFVGLRFFNQSEIDAYDETGNFLGVYSIGDGALEVGKSLQSGPFSIGISAKYVFSKLDTYRSSAIVFDWGGYYKMKSKDVQFGLVFKHFGIKIKEYEGLQDTELPYDIQAGMTFKPKHMPFRFTLSASQLTYPVNKSYNEFEKYFSKLSIGTQWVVSHSFCILAGYKYNRRQSFFVGDLAGSAGFSWGIYMAIRSVSIIYGRSTYLGGNAINQFTLNYSYLKNKS